MTDLSADIVGYLLRRTEWREGTTTERLRIVQKEAKRRAKRTYCDPELELEIAAAAKLVRRTLLDIEAER